MAKRKSSPLKNVNVERKDKGKFVIHWKPGSKDLGVDIFTGDSPRKINRKASVASVKGKTSVEIDGLEFAAQDQSQSFSCLGQGQNIR
jgi:hypothetical protein